MFKDSPTCRLTTLAALLWLCTGCAGGGLNDARKVFIHDGDPRAALQVLDEDDGTGLSALLFSMEKGLLLHEAGRFQESINELRKASALMKIQDAISVSQQASSLVINDWMTAYKGEYSERMWVHTYLMINYLLVNQPEDALVEAKQALRVFDAYPEALSEAYFSLALIGLCYEVLAEFNDAYIVYKRLAKVMPDPAPVGNALYRMGRLAGIEDPADDAFFNSTSRARPRPVFTDGGELVLFVGLGNGPVKVPGNVLLPPGVRFSFPRYENRSPAIGHTHVYDHGKPVTADAITTDVGRVARNALRDRAQQIFAKETVRVLAKEAIAREVARENDAIIGLITRLALIAVEEPDTRCWQTLPASHSLLRVPLEPGTHHLTIKTEGAEISDAIVLPPITIQKGRRIFLAVRANANYVAIHSQARSHSRQTGGL